MDNKRISCCRRNQELLQNSNLAGNSRYCFIDQESRELLPSCWEEWTLERETVDRMIRIQFSHFSMDKKGNTILYTWGTAGCKWNPVFIKGSLASHLEISIQIHCKGQQVTDLSFLPYMNLVLKAFVRCRHCCLVVRFFRIATLHLHSGLRVCARDTSLLGNIFVTIFCAGGLSALRGGGRSAGCWIAEALCSLAAFSRKTQGSHLGRWFSL